MQHPVCCKSLRHKRKCRMAAVLTQLATPRKIKLALLTLLFFAAMC